MKRSADQHETADQLAVVLPGQLSSRGISPAPRSHAKSASASISRSPRLSPYAYKVRGGRLSNHRCRRCTFCGPQQFGEARAPEKRSSRNASSVASTASKPALAAQCLRYKDGDALTSTSRWPRRLCSWTLASISGRTMAGSRREAKSRASCSSLTCPMLPMAAARKRALAEPRSHAPISKPRSHGEARTTPAAKRPRPTA